MRVLAVEFMLGTSMITTTTASAHTGTAGSSQRRTSRETSAAAATPAASPIHTPRSYVRKLPNRQASATAIANQRQPPRQRVAAMIAATAQA